MFKVLKDFQYSLAFVLVLFYFILFSLVGGGGGGGVRRERSIAVTGCIPIFAFA